MVGDGSELPEAATRVQVPRGSADHCCQSLEGQARSRGDLFWYCEGEQNNGGDQVFSFIRYSNENTAEYYVLGSLLMYLVQPIR